MTIEFSVCQAYPGSHKTITFSKFRELLDLLTKISNDDFTFSYNDSGIASLRIVQDEKPIVIPKREPNGRFKKRTKK